MVFQAVLGSPDRADAMSPGLPACLGDSDKHPHVCEVGIIQQPRDQLDRASLCPEGLERLLRALTAKQATAQIR